LLLPSAASFPHGKPHGPIGTLTDGLVSRKSSLTTRQRCGRCGAAAHCTNSTAKESLPEDRAPEPLELLFTEMYIDFLYEVRRRGRVLAFLTGRYPGTVPVTNPRTRYIYYKFVRQLYAEEVHRVVDAAMVEG
jgi:hypothetical protein